MKSLFIEGLDRPTVAAVETLFIPELDGETFSSLEELQEYDEARWEYELEQSAQFAAARYAEDTAERGGWFGYGD